MSENETEKTQLDGLSLSLRFHPEIEQLHDYIDDSKGILARNMMGQMFRQRLNIILSYQKTAGGKATGMFKNIQINVKLPKATQADKTQIKIDDLNLTSSSTPYQQEILIYAQRDLIPSDLEVEVSITYQ